VPKEKIMSYLLIAITWALVIIALTIIMNVFIFPRLKHTSPPENAPRVSVLIPARNEAAVIAKTVRKLQQQTYPDYEIIVLDDDSDDHTADLARSAGARVIAGEPLPPGWGGKNWACHLLSQAATGDILVFTDADVRWQPDALTAVVHQMQSRNIDLFTVWPTQHTKTPAERLTVPLVALAILGYLPVVMTHHSPFAMFAAANGQCMVWRRDAYHKVGGHQAVADTVLEDVTLARLARKAGFSLRMADGNRLIQTRMYSNWQTVRDGFAKNILAGYGNSVLALIAATIFHWLIFLFPWALLLTEAYRLWGIVMIAMGLTVRMLSAAFTHQRLRDAFLMPVSVLLMTIIAFQSIYWHYTGGPRWKGRTLPNPNTSHTDNTPWNPSSSSAQASAD
jgi:chlorobactene glucosyltransferase